MKVRTIKELKGTKRDVKFNAGQSVRIVLAEDKMGFSIHKTVMPKSDGVYNWHYKNHLESCYCISGKGILTNLETGEKFDIVPDTCYSLDKNDNHTFEIVEDIVLISVFNPPVTGNEIHQADGSYSS